MPPDRVILEYLRQGDSRPLADWLVNGHVPSAAVLWEVGIMLHDDKSAREQLQPLVADAGGAFGANFQYRFEKPKRRRGIPGRPNSLENDERDRLLAEAVKSRIEAGEGYDASIRAVQEEMAETCGAASKATIRAAYDQRYAKK